MIFVRPNDNVLEIRFRSFMDKPEFISCVERIKKINLLEAEGKDGEALLEKQAMAAVQTYTVMDVSGALALAVSVGLTAASISSYMF